MQTRKLHIGKYSNKINYLHRLEKVVELRGETSNQLFDTLADWNTALHDCEPRLTAAIPTESLDIK